MRRRQRDGFTLVEVLCAVAMLAVLAAFLFPVFARVRDTVRQTTCLSNLKQFETALLLYGDDYDEALPLVLMRPYEEPLRPETTWMGSLRPYLKSSAVFVDAASGKIPRELQTAGSFPASYAYAPSYRVRGYMGLMVTAPPFGTAMWDGLGGFWGCPIGDYQQPASSWQRTAVARPSETILLCDHAVFDWGLTARKLYYPAPRHLREPDLKLPNGRAAPQGRINAAFADGHVQALRHERFWEILPDYSRLGRPTRSVFRYFWPYE
jgi:prepilin-type N-terminal cleavage/methylation domain-containing protein/prepilin-type processing-associated H-X9-DG protein